MVFDYDVQDGRWHSLAVGIQGRRVSLHTSCGERVTHLDLRSRKEEALDAEGSFLLGKMNHNSVAFEGAICQFDIYPSAEAAHNYCDYIKKQCREADTYRPALPPMLPVISIRAPFPTQPASMEMSKRADGPSTTSAASTRLKPGAVLVSGSVPPGSASPADFRTSGTPPEPEPTAAGSDESATGRRDADSPKPSGGVTDLPSSSARPANELQPDPPATGAPTTPEPKVSSVQDVEATSPLPVITAATEVLQMFLLESTAFSLLDGPPGLKGEPGPAVSPHAFDARARECVRVSSATMSASLHS